MKNKSIFVLMSVMILSLLLPAAWGDEVTEFVMPAIAWRYVAPEPIYLPITADDGTELLYNMYVEILPIMVSRAADNILTIYSLDKKELIVYRNTSFKRVEKVKEYENVTLYDLGESDRYRIWYRPFWLDKNGTEFDGNFSYLNSLSAPDLKIIPKDHYEYIRDMLLDDFEGIFACFKEEMEKEKKIYLDSFLKSEREIVLNSINFYDPEIGAKYAEEIKVIGAHNDRLLKK